MNCFHPSVAGQRIFIAALTWLSLMCACSKTPSTGTSTGNPALPDGATLIKSTLERESQPSVSNADLAQLGTDNQDFAFALYAKVAQDPKAAANLFFSPYSISTGLAMTYAGAAAETQQEMKAALHYDLPEPTLHAAFNAVDQALQTRNALPDDAPESAVALELSVVNAAWTQKGFPFEPSFLDVLALNYGTGMYTVDFEADPEKQRMRINDWFSDQTHRRVKELLPPESITSDTLLALTNAVYFKGSWLLPFDKRSTHDGVFHGKSGDATLPMMHGLSHLAYALGDGYQTIELPYVAGSKSDPAVRMLLILPDEGRFDEVEAGLDRSFFDSTRAELTKTEVDLTLPRFSYTASLDLAPLLKALGMTRAFGLSTADFSRMSATPLYVANALHKAFIAVDEEGTEAAAATAVVLNSDGGISIDFKTMTVDRPFLHLIYDKPTGQILFMARVLDPQ